MPENISKAFQKTFSSQPDIASVAKNSCVERPLTKEDIKRIQDFKINIFEKQNKPDFNATNQTGFQFQISPFKVSYTEPEENYKVYVKPRIKKVYFYERTALWGIEAGGNLKINDNLKAFGEVEYNSPMLKTDRFLEKDADKGSSFKVGIRYKF